MKKYLIEGLLIFLSVLGAFALESYRLQNSKAELKNNLLIELKDVIKQDSIQINKVLTILDETFKSAVILKNDYLNDKKLKKEDLAVEFSKLRFVNISYFPQTGVFNQLLSTGSLELINNHELKRRLIYVYEHMNKRKSAGDFVLDEMSWRSFKDISDDIYVINSMEQEIDFNASKKFIFSITPVESFFVSKNYYNSKKVIQFYSQISILMKQYQDLIEQIIDEYVEINKLIETELK
jgi:hypothetical protein